MVNKQETIEIDEKLYDLMELHDKEVDEFIAPYLAKIKRGESLTELELQDIEQKRNMATIDFLNGLRGMQIPYIRNPISPNKNKTYKTSRMFSTLF